MRAAVVVLGLSQVAGALAWADPDGGAPSSPPTLDDKAVWIASVHERIHPRWSSFLVELRRLADPRYQDQTMFVELTFAVEPDGTVADVERQKGGGLPGFDDAPADLLRDLGRVPRPLAAVRSDDGRAYLRWRFQRKEPGCEQGELVERRLPVDQAVVRLVEAGAPERAVERVAEARRADPAKETALVTLLSGALGRAGAGSGDPATRAAAAAVLARGAESEPVLLKLATDKDAKVRREALEALGVRTAASARSERSREGLVRALAGPERATAARALGQLGDPGARPALRAALKTGQSPVEVAGALAALGDGDEAGRITSELLGSGDAKLRLAGVQAAQALADPALGASLVAALTVANEELRVSILDALSAAGKRTTADEKKAILHALKDSAAKVRARAWAALVASGDRSGAMKARLIDGLTETDPNVRAVIAASLVEVGGASAEGEIGRGVRDRSPLVRAAVGRALVAHPFDGATRLLARLDADSDATVKAALVEARRASDGKNAAPRPAELAERVLTAKGTAERLRAAAVYLAAVIALKK